MSETQFRASLAAPAEMVGAIQKTTAANRPQVCLALVFIPRIMPDTISPTPILIMREIVVRKLNASALVGVSS